MAPYTSRRRFVKQSSLTLLGVLASKSLIANLIQAEQKKNVGLQLYSLRDDIKKDLVGTLKKVAKIGYTRIEAAGFDNDKGTFYGYKPEDFKKIIDDLGMQLNSSHLCHNGSPKVTTKDIAWWQKAIVAHKKVGVTYMVQPCAPVNLETCTEDELKSACDYFNEIGKLCNLNGIAFGYHNHDKEFLPVSGTQKRAYDILLENTDPKNVFFEMDVYWVTKGGTNPCAYMNKYPDRIRLLHIKDDKEIGASGKINFKEIFDTAYQIGVKGYYVENEAYSFDPIVSVQKSYEYLINAPFVK